VLGVNSNTSLNGGVTVDYVYARSSFGLSDTSDSIYLEADGETIDAVVFDAAWPYEDGASLSLDFSRLSPGEGANSWCSATSEYGSGDLGTPGSENDWCSNVDHDGDGESEDDGDCNDEDATIWTGGTEIDDGIDQDCNDLFDDIDIGLSSQPNIVGPASGAYYYAYGEGDFDGDGSAELALYEVGSTASDYVYLVDGNDYADWSGDIVSDFDVAAIDPGTLRYALPARHAGDHTGDGDDDFVFAYTNSSSSGTDRYDRWYLYANPSGTLSGTDAEIRGQGTSAASFTIGRVVADADFDGDGIDEVVAGDPSASDYNSNGGRVDVFEVSSLSGTINGTSATITVKPTASGNQLGYTLGAGDYDGDGNADLMVAPNNGYVYVVPGGDLSAAAGTYSALATITVQETTPSEGATFEDYDGDGTFDVQTSSGRLYTDLDTTSGTLTTGAASQDFSGTSTYLCGVQPTRADPDGDGATDRAYRCNSTAVSGGYVVTIFLGGDSIDAATTDPSDAFVGYWSNLPYACLNLVEDLDGDGDEELVSATMPAPRTPTTGGRTRWSRSRGESRGHAAPLGCAMPRCAPTPPPSRNFEEVRAWLLSVDPDLVAASEEVDVSLIRDTLALSPRERLDRASATVRWIGEFRRAASR
jgi:hypothetical protein